MFLTLPTFKEWYKNEYTLHRIWPKLKVVKKKKIKPSHPSKLPCCPVRYKWVLNPRVMYRGKTHHSPDLCQLPPHSTVKRDFKFCFMNWLTIQTWKELSWTFQNALTHCLSFTNQKFWKVDVADTLSLGQDQISPVNNRAP